MDAAQTLEIYKILNFHFKNEENATKVVRDIQLIIDQKFEEKKDILATKEDIVRLELSTKEDIMRLELRLNDQFKWLMGTIIAMGGLIVALIKFIK